LKDALLLFSFYAASSSLGLPDFRFEAETAIAALQYCTAFRSRPNTFPRCDIWM
jgi:hypothetical protein